MATTSASPMCSRDVLRALARSRWALCVLLATGCGLRTSLDQPGAAPATNTGGSTSTGGSSSQGVGGNPAGGKSAGGADGSGGYTLSGGAPAHGGSHATGGLVTTGGSKSTGGSAVGGAGGSSVSGKGGSVGGAGGSSMAKIVCSDVGSLQKTFNTDYDGAFVPVNGSRKQYFFQSNWWTSYDGETIAVNGLSYTLANPTSAQATGTDPLGYPSFFIGTYDDHDTVGSNLPKQVSALTHVPAIMSTNAFSMGTNNFNASYDLWFTADSSPLPSGQYSPDAELTVWLFMPSGGQPHGTLTHRAQNVAGLPGTWDIWIDDPPCVFYVATTPLENLELDLNNVIQDAVKNGYGITSDMYLSIIFGGFEVWGGGDGLQLKSFCANVL